MTVLRTKQFDERMASVFARHHSTFCLVRSVHIHVAERAAQFSLARSTTGMTFSLLTCKRISGGSVLGPPLISGGPNLASSQNPAKLAAYSYDSCSALMSAAAWSSIFRSARDDSPFFRIRIL